MMTVRLALLALTLMVPTAAAAQDDREERDYCPTRPGLGSPACTIAPGHVSVETALVDWTLDRQSSDRSDTILFGDTMVRVGVADAAELQIGWTPAGLVRDRQDGRVDRRVRAGDVTLGARINFAHPDGNGLSFAVQPYVTLPVGRAPVGAGDWGAGVIAPVTFDLNDAITVEFTPEIDAAVDQDRRGRHLACSGTIGAGVALSKAVTLTVENQLSRDDDPAGGATQDRAALSIAWLARDDLQFDAGGVAGVSGGAPDLELYVGVSRRF